MQIRATPPEQMLAAHRSEAILAAPPPAPVNRDAVLQLFELPPLEWDNETYPVRPLTYPEGLQLQRLQLVLQTAETDAASINAREKAYDDACALFWDFLQPKPDVNPFFSLLPEEVGALMGFFFALQTKPNVRSRFRMTGPPSPSTT
jgi:hypothetical protein